MCTTNLTWINVNENESNEQLDDIIVMIGKMKIILKSLEYKSCLVSLLQTL